MAYDHMPLPTIHQPYYNTATVCGIIMLAMPTGRQLRPAAILALVLALGWCAPASAQPYPGKPIRRTESAKWGKVIKDANMKVE